MKMPDNATPILEGKNFEITISRLCYQLIEVHGNFENTILIGLQPRGIYLCEALKEALLSLTGIKVKEGKIDPTFYRDDFNRRESPLIPSATEMSHQIEGKNIVIIDDVLYTGRTIRAGMDALLDYGRPATVQLLTLVDRNYSRQVPIQPDYRGIIVDTRAQMRVKVEWQAAGHPENKVWLYSENK
ncbi:MAG: bifunctional pyr operon transcriptional regulator/uracil phosphoribosyltransferase PyrR [Bacteroidota bacterium]|nr:bifunctional pyr operon transcriptional regulator/uracil phosphoribosyltransferase PyrR [Bacteroidota bacterium]